MSSLHFDNPKQHGIKLYCILKCILVLNLVLLLSTSAFILLGRSNGLDEDKLDSAVINEAVQTSQLSAFGEFYLLGADGVLSVRRFLLADRPVLKRYTQTNMYCR